MIWLFFQIERFSQNCVDWELDAVNRLFFVKVYCCCCCGAGGDGRSSGKCFLISCSIILVAKETVCRVKKDHDFGEKWTVRWNSHKASKKLRWLTCSRSYSSAAVLLVSAEGVAFLVPGDSSLRIHTILWVFLLLLYVFDLLALPASFWKSKSSQPLR